MADCIYLVKRVDRFVLTLGQSLKHMTHGIVVILHRDRDDDLIIVYTMLVR